MEAFKPSRSTTHDAASRPGYARPCCQPYNTRFLECSYWAGHIAYGLSYHQGGLRFVSTEDETQLVRCLSRTGTTTVEAVIDDRLRSVG